MIKVLAGLVNAWMNLHYYAVSDSVGFHREGIAEYHLMFKDPREYVVNLFTSNYKNSYGAVFDITDSFWNNLKSNIIIKLLSLFDILSRGNYFINVLFYNFLVFFGSVALYRIFIQIFADRRKMLVVTVFLLPSFLYFTSGIHRDGLIFLTVAFVFFNMFGILRHRFTTKRLIYALFNLILIFLLRNFVFITILPALLAWIIAEKKQKSFLAAFIFIYACFSLIFFSLKSLHPSLDLPRYVSARQMAFITLSQQSNSAININPLFPEFRSFFNNMPQALNHALMRPYLLEYKKFLYVPVSVEIALYEILLLLLILFPLKKAINNSFIYCGIFFTLSMFLVIGYTIPILGALIRYRSIYWPFIITPVVCSIDFTKMRIKHLYFNNIIKMS